MSIQKTVSLISAVPFESSPTHELLKSYEIPVKSHHLGIGPLNSRDFKPQIANLAGTKVIYIGTAGSFGNFSKPYLTQVKRAIWSPTGERLSLAKSFDSLFPPVEFTLSNHDLQQVTCVGSTSVSLCDKSIFSSASVENMELYPIASALQQHCPDLHILFGITNQVGPEGSKQWQQNHQATAQLTADYLKEYLCLT